MDRLDAGVSVHETEPFFCFHHVNAFEQEGELVVDLVAYPDHSLIQTLQIDWLRDSNRPQMFGQLRRYRIALSTGKVHSQPLSDVELELPRIDYRGFNTRPYRHVYATSTAGAESNWVDQLVKVDVGTGEACTWREDDCYPGEPIFVPAPDGHAEDDGVVLSVVLDARKQRSFLLALDARDLQEQARAEVPHHIPYGFHGNFFSD